MPTPRPPGRSPSGTTRSTRYYHRAVDRLTQLAKETPTTWSARCSLLIAARYMERVGDHITNIAEDVVFLSSGQHEDLNP